MKGATRVKGFLSLCMAVLMSMGSLAYGQGQDDDFGPPDGPPPHEFEQGNEQERQQRHERRRQQMRKYLELSDEQDRRLDEFHKNERKEHKSLRQKMHDTHKALRDELDKYNSDKGKIETLIKEINAAHDALTRSRVESITKVKAILTPEQFEKLVAKMKEHKRQRHERRKKRSESGERDQRGGPGGGSRQGRGDGGGGFGF